MDIKYIQLRIKTFRREYFDISSKWLKNSWSWIWSFTVDNFKYLYIGEINQNRYLKSTIRQKDEYIDSLQKSLGGRSSKDPVKNKPYFLPRIQLIVHIVLLPISFLVYWIRRLFRISIQPLHEFLVNDSVEYNGQCEKVYLKSARKRSLPRGLVLFNYALTISKGSPEPKLYIDCGIGFSAEYSIPLPYCNDSQPIELLIEMPPDCEKLAFQATTGTGYFTLKNVSMKEISIITAAKYLKTRYRYNTNDLLHSLFIKKLPGVTRTIAQKVSFAEWNYKFTKLSDFDRRAIKSDLTNLKLEIKFNIILNINNSHPALLDQCIQSLSKQLFSNWSLFITCEEIPDTHVVSVLNKYERDDKRLKLIINKDTANVSDNIQDAIDQYVSGYTIFFEHHDLLSEHALYLFAHWINKYPDGKIFYSDYDHIDFHGYVSDPIFKPDWNYNYFLGKNYIQYLVCYESDYLKKRIDSKNINPLTESSRSNIILTEGLDASVIKHIPYITLHHRKLDSEAKLVNDTKLKHDKKSLNGHFERTDQLATAEKTVSGFWIKRTISSPQPLISLVVLTRDRVALLSNCIHGLLDKTYYRNIEIIIIDNDSVEEETFTFLDAISKNDRVKVLRNPIDFNFSELNNFAVEHASGNYIGLINNDISVIEPGWLDEMMGHLVRDDVGIVGAKLLYENDTIQHAGVILGLGGVAGHAFRHYPRHYRCYDDRLLLCQELSCVTAACLLTKKKHYREVGGLDAVNLRIAFNDVDYCLKIREKGFKVIWTPFAELYHLESASRASDLSKENIDRWNAEYNFMRNKWIYILERDPYYNPNLTITDEDFSLAYPPRLHHPWERLKNIRPSDNDMSGEDVPSLQNSESAD